ncbi:MAG: hypothetical protein FJX34_05965 [Alphaproteobacteria bacterium]|nr:hypothetical protein [Alphaproteobacteria bacterium]
MLVRLSLISFVLLLLSCGGQKRQYFHTEILCDGKPPIMVRYTKPEEVRASIIWGDAEKRKKRTSENYTVIYASGDRSVKIQNIPPEEMLKCQLRTITVINPDKRITKFID